MKARKMSFIIALVVLSLIVSACGNSGGGNQNKGGMDMGNKDMGNMDMGNSQSGSDAGSAGEVTAVASNWKWELSQTEFKVGETVTFSVQSKEGVHGFSIEGTDINQQIAPGETKTVTWTPDKAGEYTIACSVACGAGHNDMVQKITVSE
ncbi:MAG TPA: cupredoxin domain-containing protein [Paenibacillus sp.]|uniref:cupredoxin domain-containing protein n=1 Tax=Paenibacillus sp. TaxID=58172 RepID=UPI0028D34364|nr:cupredoxin domain-containing protein [Paenibacillus sp.]HUC91184.1 cupredoxin domain-containing protein [Paenibacillus sp.]